MSFSFIQITDHHLGENAQDNTRGYPAAATLQAVLDAISGSDVDFDFLLSSGDLVNKPVEASYDFFKSLLGARPAAHMPGPLRMNYGRLHDFPLYVMPGNHDDRDVFFRSMYTDGQPGLQNASFQHKGVNFVMMDTGPSVQAFIGDETLEFLRQALDTNLPNVLLTHHNVASLHVPLLDDFIAENAQTFCDLLRGKNVLAIISGHLHTTYETMLMDIPVLGLRSTAFQFKVEERLVMALLPMHYRVVTIDDGMRLSSRIVEVPVPPGVEIL